MREIRVKQNSDRNINIRRDIPNNINDSNSSDSKNNNLSLGNGNIFAGNNNLPIRNENIPCINNNLSKVEFLRDYLRKDLGEHLITIIGFEKGIEILEY